MTIYFVDGFETYGTSGDQKALVAQKWKFTADDAVGHEGAATITTGGYLGGYVAQIESPDAGTNAGYATIDLTELEGVGSKTTLMVTFRMLAGSTNAQTDSSFLRLLAADGDVMLHLAFDDQDLSNLNIYKNGTPDAWSGGANLATGAVASELNCFEVKVVIHGSTGSIVVKCNGSTIYSLTGADTTTGASGSDAIKFVQFTSGNLKTNAGMSPTTHTGYSTYATYDDVVIGSDFITGAHTSTEELPALDGDGNTDNVWDESTGTDAYSLLGFPSDGDSSYVETNATGNKQLLTQAALSRVAGTVHAVVQNIVVKDTGTIGNIDHVLRVGSTDYAGGTFTPTASYSNYQRVVESNPAGGAWSVSSVNAMETGFTT